MSVSDKGKRSCAAAKSHAKMLELSTLAKRLVVIVYIAMENHPFLVGKSSKNVPLSSIVHRKHGIIHSPKASGMALASV